MLEKPLQFVAGSLDEFLKLKTKAMGNEALVVLSELVDENGKFAVKQGQVGLFVINIEEERVNKAQVPETRRSNGEIGYINPEIRLNLYLLFAANHKNYDDSLKAISNVIAFFQANSVFRPETHPALAPEVKKLIFDLCSYSFEELSYIWGVVGTSYRPSVIFKMRLVHIQEGLQRGTGGKIVHTDYDFHGIR